MSRPKLLDEVRALVLKAQGTVSGRLGLADQINALLDGFPAACDHEWSDRGSSPEDRWRECWLCGEQEDVA